MGRRVRRRGSKRGRRGRRGRVSGALGPGDGSLGLDLPAVDGVRLVGERVVHCVNVSEGDEAEAS